LNSRFQLFRNEVSGTVTPYQMIFELAWPPTSGLPTSRSEHSTTYAQVRLASKHRLAAMDEGHK
jgi:hypothetical protein